MSTQASGETDTADIRMRYDPARAKALVDAFTTVSERVAKVAGGRNVRIVAVSKLKPASDILALHREGKVDHFGENYAQELMEKAELLPRSVRWHFIGGLQSNKCKPLSSSIPNLYLVSSVDSIKKANGLNSGRSLLPSSEPPNTPLNIHIQINTSSEEAKSGTAPGVETTALAKHVIEECPHLCLKGVMTIGAIARSTAPRDGQENEDFTLLRSERDRLERELDLEAGSLELSMGMSNDFESAVGMGSGEVRVGSTVFGERGRREDAVV